jgi:predicted ArsR family transcriptional regulator
MATVPAYDVVHATSPEQVIALSHPTRHALLGAIAPDGATVSQLSNRLGINKGNVAHHLHVLCRAGLARKGPTRTVRGGTEQYFVPVGRRFSFPPGEDGAATRAMLAALAEDLAADDDPLLNHRVVRLTQAQAESLRDHLETLVDGLQPAGPGEAEYGVVVGLHRRG